MAEFFFVLIFWGLLTGLRWDVSDKIQQRPQITRFLLVYMGGQGYFSLSIFHYESLLNGEVMDKIDKWLTIDELASYIKMSRTKLYGMAQRGEVPASKIGNQWRFDREEIDQWMKAHATGNVGSDNKDKKQ